jgi:hypothetical protein
MGPDDSARIVNGTRSRDNRSASRRALQPVLDQHAQTEGFFDVCKAKGITGKQRVMIPRGNMQNLALRDNVVEAIQARKFTIYAVATPSTKALRC